MHDLGCCHNEYLTQDMVIIGIVQSARVKLSNLSCWQHFPWKKLQVDNFVKKICFICLICGYAICTLFVSCHKINYEEKALLFYFKNGLHINDLLLI